MSIAENIQMLRKKNSLSQEELAAVLNVSRQAVGKWENGTTYPDLEKLIQLSDYFKISLDRLVKEAKNCDLHVKNKEKIDNDQLIQFLLKAKKETYAGHGKEIKASRIASHDLEYKDGEFYYYDSYIGGERFGGEEAVWIKNKPYWCMNYYGRVIGENFNGEFLKDALLNVPYESPYRGPALYQNGEYTYHCKTEGSFEFYQGYEEIFYDGKKIYECIFNGGIVR
ncbi:helix-turn-helix transcriptional regulator [Clostridium botulinum]|nr:helix-turn-helix transcriptional regulator [Clostridium botulinum]